MDVQLADVHASSTPMKVEEASLRGTKPPAVLDIPGLDRRFGLIGCLRAR
jgi:hypothetical protein